MNNKLIPNINTLVKNQWFPTTIKWLSTSKVDVECVTIITGRFNKIHKNELVKYQILYIPIIETTIIKSVDGMIVRFNTKNFKEVLKLEKQLSGKNGSLPNSVLTYVKKLELSTDTIESKALNYTLASEQDIKDFNIVTSIIVVED